MNNFHHHGLTEYLSFILGVCISLIKMSFDFGPKFKIEVNLYTN